MSSCCGNSGDAASTKALHLCEAYLALNERRLTLNEQLMAPSPAEQEQELLWCELDDVLTESSDLLLQLAAISSIQPPAMRAKAAILALVLRSPDADLAPLSPEATMLALSVADEIARLT